MLFYGLPRAWCRVRSLLNADHHQHKKCRLNHSYCLPVSWHRFPLMQHTSYSSTNQNLHSCSRSYWLLSDVDWKSRLPRSTATRRIGLGDWWTCHFQPILQSKCRTNCDFCKGDTRHATTTLQPWEISKKSWTLHEHQNQKRKSGYCGWDIHCCSSLQCPHKHVKHVQLIQTCQDYPKHIK